MKISHFVITGVLFCTLSCTKSPSPAPVGNLGDNTIAFKLNGQVHTIQGESTQGSPKGVLYFKRKFNATDGGIIVEADGANEVLSLFIREDQLQPTLNQKYAITDYYPIRGSYYHGNDPNHVFESDEDSSNTLTFTKFDQSGTAGTFEFKGTDTFGNTVIITEGKFNILNY